MTRPLNRRRFLTISASALALPLMPRLAQAQIPVAEWRGTALGAGATMKLAGLDDAAAQEVFRRVEAEVARLEAIFSLYRPDSALARLNHEGHLAQPPAEMLELLTLAGAVHASTDGAFDPTIQPLWAAYAEGAGRPDESAREAARAHIGWADLRLAPDLVEFSRAGMGLTLNGIAQGYITDRIAALLRAQGLGDVLIDMGEIVARGERPGGGPWEAGIATPEGELVGRLVLVDRALATSAPLGTTLDSEGQVGHIIDPATGRPTTARRLVSVSADTAALADALSTAFCTMTDRGAIDRALALHEGARLEHIA